MAVDELAVAQRAGAGRRVAAASVSCVTSSTPAPRSCATERSSSTISRLRALSRLPVGSSARISFGSPASARAIATRWRSPPESCSGVRSTRSPSRRARATRARGAGLARPDAAEHQLDRGVLQRRDAGHQAEALVDEADVAQQVVGRLVLGERGEIAPVEADRALLGCQQRAAISSSSVVLPEPLGPCSATISPGSSAG